MFEVIKSDLATLEENLVRDVTSSVDLITEVGTHLVCAGGKRIRPALCLLTAHGGPDFSLEYTLPLAESLELIHTASLVHDDVIDQADTRRGAATANAKWGNQVAILSGDYIFARAFALVAEKGYDAKIYHAMANLVANLSVGEILQDYKVYQAVRDEQDYYDRIQKKTADFLETCCLVGADAGGMEQEEIDQLAVYGHDIGMAFQITDDLLDILESSDQIGKPAGNDIRQGIVTLPVIRALQKSPHGEELERIVTDPEMTDDMVARALEIVKATDGADYAKRKADAFLLDAKRHLPARLPDDIRNAFIQLADFIGNRDF
ncbi:MAG: polyprenyl synthetase family protein [Selenomonadaceae bacterium]|nr:polyprenyl synthetase family protein [Selenomonadaceae bacterium]